MEHPDVARITKTGHGEPELRRIGVCKVCMEDVMPWEAYGECEGDLVHEDCIDAEWGELSTKEKMEILGFAAVNL